MTRVYGITNKFLFSINDIIINIILSLKSILAAGSIKIKINCFCKKYMDIRHFGHYRNFHNICQLNVTTEIMIKISLWWRPITDPSTRPMNNFWDGQNLYYKKNTGLYHTSRISHWTKLWIKVIIISTHL